MEWSTPRRPALLPVGFVEPCLPSVRATAPRGREWVHEIKFNGIRLIVRRDGKRARVYTRRGFDWTERFPWIEDAPNQSAMPRGELAHVYNQSSVQTGEGNQGRFALPGGR